MSSAHESSVNANAWRRMWCQAMGAAPPRCQRCRSRQNLLPLANLQICLLPQSPAPAAAVLRSVVRYSLLSSPILPLPVICKDESLITLELTVLWPNRTQRTSIVASKCMQTTRVWRETGVSSFNQSNCTVVSGYKMSTELSAASPQ